MSRMTETLDALVALWTPATSATVFDGPIVSGEEPVQRVYVGYDGDPDGDFTAATSDQAWAGTIGAQRRDEGITVPCAARVDRGDGNVKQARTDADALFEVLSDALRGNVSLGFPPPSTAQIVNARLHTYPDTNRGVVARIAFDVAISTRI